MMQTKMAKLIGKNLNNLSNKISILSDCLCLLQISMLGSTYFFYFFLKIYVTDVMGSMGDFGGGEIRGGGWDWGLGIFGFC